MNRSFYSLAAAAALVVTLAPRGTRRRHEREGRGPRPRWPDVHGAHLPVLEPASLQVSAWAEGLVNGKRQSLPLSIKKTSKPGVFQFTRTVAGRRSVGDPDGAGRWPPARHRHVAR
jgi:hypothetical protein